LQAPARLCAARLVASVLAARRNTALHLASEDGYIESLRKTEVEHHAKYAAKAEQKCAFKACIGWAKTARGELCAVRVWAYVSVPCRCIASRNSHTESVKALLEKGADMNAENKHKCEFSCGLVLDGRRLHAPAKAACDSTRGGAGRRHAGRRRCISHLAVATLRV
jgi:hypothetical protein